MYEQLMEQVVADESRGRALEAVQRNRGAAGIDRMPSSELEAHLQAEGRERALRRLGVHPRLLRTVHTSRGAWRMAHSSTVCAGLKNRTLRYYGFWMPSDLAARS